MSDLIIIDITDRENTILKGSNELKKITGKGTLLVKNPSQTSRLWNLECDLKEVLNTSSERQLDVGILNPGKKYDHQYEIENLKNPCLNVKEIFDTAREISDKVNNVFLFGNQNLCKIELNLKNTLEVPILEVKLKREMPAFFQNLELRNPSNGNIELSEEDGKRTILWNLESINPGETAKAVIIFNAVINERKDYELGELNVTHLINNHQLTLMDPEVRGLTDSLSGLI
jgi:hypothetical protein